MKKMNRFATTALAVGGLFAGAFAAHAQDVTSPANTAPGDKDLILAFNVSGNSNSSGDIGGTQDLEVDLGSLASLGSSASFDISADLDAIYGNPATAGADAWNSSTRPDLLTWSIFGVNEETNEFYVTNSGSGPKEEASNVQQPVVNEVEEIYGDLATTGTTTNGSAQAAHSGNENESNDPNSFGQVYTSDFGYGSHWGSGNPLQNASVSTPVAFYDVNSSDNGGTAGAHAPEVGTFALASDGVVTYTAAAIPEPSTWASMLFGAASLLAFRRRRS
jgi:hypothetical protein